MAMNFTIDVYKYNNKYYANVRDNDDPDTPSDVIEETTKKKLATRLSEYLELEIVEGMD